MCKMCKTCVSVSEGLARVKKFRNLLVLLVVCVSEDIESNDFKSDASADFATRAQIYRIPDRTRLKMIDV